MVKQSLKDIDTKKIKLAKKVLALFEVMGINEEDLNEVSDIKKTLGSIDERLKKLETFRESVIRTNKNELEKGTINPNSIQEQIKNAFGHQVEELHVNGR